jgi:hypothetical protein
VNDASKQGYFSGQDPEDQNHIRLGGCKILGGSPHPETCLQNEERFEMSDDHKSFSPIAQKLRGIGLIPLPRWWVTPTEADIISRIAKHHLPTVMRIKEEIWREQDYY